MKWLSKLLLSIIFILVVLICVNYNDNYKNIIKDKLFYHNINFSRWNQIFKFNKNKDIMTYNENLNYIDKIKEDDHYLIMFEEGSQVNALKPGIIVFIGDKDDCNNCMIIQGVDGIDLWYGNLNNINYSIYDYVTSGDIIGEIDDKLYLKILSNGKSLTYEEYIR